MRTLIDYLTDAVTKRPDGVAVELRGDTLTYAELDDQSAALAATLRDLGVSSGDRVGVWLRKSFEAIVAVHGILRAGAAYVPIDPSAPLGRVEKILIDCELTCVIAHDEYTGWLRDAPGRARAVVVVGPARDARAVSWQDAVTVTPAHPGPPPASHDPAYVLYTSGSLGVPKGVVLSHANAMAFVEWAVLEFGIDSDDRLSGHAPLHFDLSVLDVFAACLAGACLVLIPEDQAGMGGVLNRVVTERNVTVWYSVPNALTRMVTAPNNELLRESSVRVVLFAGETFPLGPLRRLRAVVPQAALYNLYGPTETNVCTYHRVRDADIAPGRTEPVPIGAPCPYATVHLVDHSGQSVDQVPGATGELCVAGGSVMLGYWRDDRLTADRTLNAGTENAAYRTGDIVRVCDDLTYAFLGRNDDMVKVRGHRVELGEVESALSEAVREVMCVVTGEGDEKHIEAYVVPLAPDTSALDLLRHCRALLPRYMVPERFHFVAGLPRTSSGKLDRRALSGRQR